MGTWRQEISSLYARFVVATPGRLLDLVAQNALANARGQSVDARWQWRTALAQLAHDVGVLNARGDTSFSRLTPAPDVRPNR